MFSANTSIAISDRVAENHTLFLQKTQDIIRKQLAFTRNDGVSLRSFEQDSLQKYFFLKQGEKKWPLVRMAQVYVALKAMASKTNAIVRYHVRIVIIYFLQTYQRFFIDHGHTFAGLLLCAYREMLMINETKSMKIHSKWKGRSSHYMMYCV